MISLLSPLCPRCDKNRHPPPSLLPSYLSFLSSLLFFPLNYPRTKPGYLSNGFLPLPLFSPSFTTPFHPLSRISKLPLLTSRECIYSRYNNDSVKRPVLSVLGVKSIYNMQNADGPVSYLRYANIYIYIYRLRARFVRSHTTTLHIRARARVSIFDIGPRDDNCVSIKRAPHKNVVSELIPLYGTSFSTPFISID